MIKLLSTCDQKILASLLTFEMDVSRFFNYKIIMFDKTVYNQNCIGLTEKVFLLSFRTRSGIKITDQLEYRI